MRANTKYIKQCVAMSLILSSVLLSGCANKIDEVSQKMMDDINAIGTVEISDEETIEKAEKLYGTLTDKQKEQVNNYADLLNARDELDKLLEEKAKKDAEEAEKAKAEKEKLYTDDIKKCARAILSIKEMINDPDSLQVHNALNLTSDQGNPSLIIDASCKTTSGGTNRHYYITTDDLDFAKDLIRAGAYYSYTYNIACGGADDLFDDRTFNLLAEKDGLDLEIVNSLLEDYEETKDKTKLGLIN